MCPHVPQSINLAIICVKSESVKRRIAIGLQYELAFSCQITFPHIERTVLVKVSYTY
jgi:hypothetical protein